MNVFVLVNISAARLQDFEDITAGFSLEKTATVAEPSDTNDGKDDATASMHLTQDEMYDISRAHHALFTGFTATAWHQAAAPQDARPDYLQPLLAGYQMAALVGRDMADNVLGTCRANDRGDDVILPC